VLAQNNVQLAEEQTFKLASVACLSKLMAVEARMQAGGPPSTLPWNQFLTENIIASIPAAPLQLPDIHFLTMVPSSPQWTAHLLTWRITHTHTHTRSSATSRGGCRV
jgi:hypothetical protein